MGHYIIFNHGQTKDGNARDLLEQIRMEASRENQEIAQMSVDQYADAIVEDAPYFLDDTLLKALEAQNLGDKFDRALNYLAQMPTSGVRILTSAQVIT